VLFVLGSPSPSLAQGGLSLIDPSDGWFDTTQMLAGKGGFLPVPILITEPALEWGGGAALVFLHSDIPLPPCDPGQDPSSPPPDAANPASPEAHAAPDSARDSMSDPAPEGTPRAELTDDEAEAETETETDADAEVEPPRQFCRDASGFLDHVEPIKMTGVFGAATGNESWFAGAMHSSNWLHDHLRYSGFAAYTHVNLTYYGAGNDFGGEGVPWNSQGVVTDHNVLVRFWDIPLFVGAEYLFLYMQTGFGLEVPPELGIPMSFETREGGLGFRARLDYRDNPLTPNRGIFVDGTVQQFGEYFGGLNEFTQGNAEIQVFVQPWTPLIIGLKIAGDFSTSDAPFYMLPSINLRGITLMRYQGEVVLQGETEIRFQIVPRVGVVGFFGMGQASNSLDETGDTRVKLAGGGGLRYPLARGYGLHAGVDVARGPDSWTFHITIGQSWGGL